MTLVAALAGVAGLLITGVLGAAAGRKNPAFIYILCCAFCGALAAAAIATLFSPPLSAEEIVLPLGLPWIGVHFAIDPLAAAFLLVIDLTAAITSTFAIGYSRHEHANNRVLPFYPVFLAGMNLVVLAHDAFGFLLAWEFMSLTSWALVLAQHRERENARAAYIYFVMASFGTLMLLLAFGLLAGADGSYTFAGMRAHHLSPLLASIVLFLALAGAGSKAGLVPLHVWLPLAHPAAPSHVSALMSGVMTKVAVYGFIRIVLDLLGIQLWWWGIPVMIVGAATAILGILSAVFQTDTKRLLAYSTVENIGIVFIGLGLSMSFAGDNLAAYAGVALIAALLHVFNHAMFKSLLFCSGGSMLVATGTRAMEKLGGLIHRMPLTALATLVGAAAISALPPLNGFASEWLLFQTILLSPSFTSWSLKLLAPSIGAVLALAAAIAAACFVRYFGMSFLGRARSPEAAAAVEADRSSLVAMAMFAVLCIVSGIVPGLAADLLRPAVSQLLPQGAMTPQIAVPWLSLVPIAPERSSYNGVLLFLFVLLSASLMAAIVRRVASHRVRRSDAWDCGFPDPRPVTQYSASSFAQPLRRVFGPLLFGATETVGLPPPGDLRPATFAAVIHDRIWDVLYRPLAGLVTGAAERLNRFQFLTVRRYLSLVFGTLVLLLCILAFLSRS
jgi:formate hydrogenlyase subunit 3/multisubunit Na+/H+ antiporter MnhD subunit